MNTVRLGDIADFPNGKHLQKKDCVDGPYPVIGGGHKPKAYHNAFNSEPNTIVVSTDGAYAGLVSKRDEHIWAADHCFRVVLKSNNDLDNLYLFYCLKSYQSNFYSMQIGSAQPGFRSRMIKELEIPWPDADRRAEIVAEMQKIEAAKEALQQTRQSLEPLMKSVANEILDSNNEVCVSDVGSITRGKCLTKSQINGGDYAVIGGGKTRGFYPEYNRDANTILIARKGSAGLVSKYSERVWITDNCFSLIPNEGSDNEYLYYAMLLLIQEKIKRIAGGIGAKGIRPEHILDQKIPWPDADERAAIVERLATIEAAQQRCDETEAALDNLYKSRLHEAFQE